MCMVVSMPLSSPNQLFCGTGWRGYVCRLPIGRCWLGALLLVIHAATCSMWVSDSQFWPIFCDFTKGVMPWCVLNLRDKYYWQNILSKIFVQHMLFLCQLKTQQNLRMQLLSLQYRHQNRVHPTCRSITFMFLPFRRDFLGDGGWS